MTAPMPSSGPPDRGQRDDSVLRGRHDDRRSASHDQPYNPWAAPASGPSDPAGPLPPARSADVRHELRDGAVVTVAVTVLGVLLGVLWVWLAPRVPLISDGSAVFLKDSESEEAVGADGTFALLAAGLGVITGTLVFLCRKGGGVGLVCGLAAGAVLGSVLAWRFGVWLGPSQDVAAHAREVGAGKVFDAPLELRAKGVLLAWPLAALGAHLMLTGAFGPRDPQPPVHPQWGPPPQA